jgi:hypothetical protein
VKGGDGEEKEDVDAAAALPHAVAPVETPSVYCCGGERSTYCCGGAEESKGGDSEEEEDANVAATFAHAAAPVGASSAAAAGLYGECRGYSESCYSAELRRFRKNQVTRRDSVARRTTFGNWHLEAEQGFTLIIARAEFQDRKSKQDCALEFDPKKPPDYREEVE